MRFSGSSRLPRGIDAQAGGLGVGRTPAVVVEMKDGSGIRGPVERRRWIAASLHGHYQSCRWRISRHRVNPETFSELLWWKNLPGFEIAPGAAGWQHQASRRHDIEALAEPPLFDQVRQVLWWI
jgi:hypothetical protein